MKKLFLFALPLVALSFASCSDDDAPVINPTVSVVAEGAEKTSLTFTVTPENAEKCAYVCLEAGEEVPTAEEILADEANAVSPDEATLVEVTGLTPDTEYVIVAAVSYGDKTALSETVTIKTKELVFDIINFNDCEFAAGKNTNVVSNGGSFTEFNCVFQYAEKYTMVSGCVVSEVYSINDDKSSSPKSYGVALQPAEDSEEPLNKFLYVTKYDYSPLNTEQGSTAFAFADGEERIVYSLDVMNSTDMYQYMTVGWYSYDPMVAGDWCLLTLTGYAADGTETGTVETYLADLRDGQDLVLSDWTTVNTEALGKVNKVTLTVTWSESWGKPSPKNYSVCLDNVKLLVED